jgi:hypothetical protein
MPNIDVLRHLLDVDDFSSLPRTDILLVRHDNDCGCLVDGRWYAQLLDSIADELPDVSFISVALPYSKESGDKSYRRAWSFNGAFARESFVKRVRSILDRSVDYRETAHCATWTCILQRTRPRVVIAVQPSGSLSSACHRLGIAIMDIQHGFIGDSNPGYGQAFQSGRARDNLPDHILCWDETSAEALRKWAPQKGIRVRVIGNPWISKFLNRKADDFVIGYFDKLLTNELSTKQRPRILVSLQWGLDNPEVIPDQALFANEFVTHALESAIFSTLDRYQWIVRPHPAQRKSVATFKRLQEYCARRFDGRVSISTDIPLPCVLSVSDLHITYNSSVVMEADTLGVPSAMLDPQLDEGMWSGYFQEQRKKGTADLICCEAESIMEWINRRLSQYKPASRIDLGMMDEYQRFLNDLRAS